ncbi:MAG: hypothetical protein WBG36_13835 [Ornithinimicrobium sp.]
MHSACSVDHTGGLQLTTKRSAIRPWRFSDAGLLLHPDNLGQGWASAAARAMWRYVCSAGHLQVWPLMWASNAVSAAAREPIGMTERIGMTEPGAGVDPWCGTGTAAESRAYLWET